MIFKNIMCMDARLIWDKFFRCIFDVELDKSLVNKEAVKEPQKKKMAIANIKKEFENHYKTADKSKWIFTKLRF